MDSFVPWNRTAAVICAALLSGCGSAIHYVGQGTLVAVPSQWPMYQYHPSHNAVFSGELEVRWGFQAPKKVNGGLAVVGSTIYVDSFNKQVYALDIKTGHVKWSAKSGAILMSTPIVYDGRVAIGSGDNNFLEDSPQQVIWGSPGGDAVSAFAADDGHLIWKFRTIGEDMPSAALYGNRLVFANGDMHAYALNADSGKLLWKTGTPGVSTMASAAVAGGVAFFVAGMGGDTEYDPATNDHTVAIDVRSGKRRWISPYGSPDCSPTVGGGMVFVEDTVNVKTETDTYPYAGRDQVVALDERTGRRIWEYESRTGFYTSVGTSERAVAGTYESGIFYDSIPAVSRLNAFDAQTGHVIWSTPTLGPVKMSPVVLGNYLYVGDTAGLLYTLDVRTGRIVHVHAFTAPFSASSPVIVGKTIFVVEGKTLYATPLSDFAPDKGLMKATD